MNNVMLTVQEFMLVTATFLAYVTLAWLITSDIALGVPVLLGHEIGGRTIAATFYNITSTGRPAIAVQDTGMLAALGRDILTAAIKEWER